MYTLSQRNSILVGIIFALVLLVLPDVHASLSSVYIAQSAAGAGDGSSCANAKAVSFFNTGANWGMGAAQIGAGTTVNLCGTITTDLSFQGSGSAGGSSNCGGGADGVGPAAVACTPVWLEGSPGGVAATINAQVLVGNQQYIYIHGGSWGVPAADNCATTGSNPTNAINVGGTGSPGTGGFVTIDSVDIENTISGLVYLNSHGSNVLMMNSTLKNTNAANTVCQIDLFDTSGMHDVTVVGNYLENRTGSGNVSHDDVMQTWNGGAGAPYNWDVAYNEFVMNAGGTNNVSWMILEQLGTGHFNIFNNLFLGITGAIAGNGIVADANTAGITITIDSNTVINKNGPNNLFNITGSGTFLLTNNIIYNVQAGNALTGGTVPAANRTTNIWRGNNIPTCTGTNGDICSSSLTTTDLFVDFTNNNFALPSGSPAIGAGTNLFTSYGKGFAAGATWPNPTLTARPSVGAWDVGAFQFVSASTGGSAISGASVVAGNSVQ